MIIVTTPVIGLVNEKALFVANQKVSLTGLS